MAKKITKVRFVGDPDQYIGGIPARNLTPEEWDRLSDRLREKAIDSGLYKLSAAAGKKSDKDAAASASEV